MKVIKRDGRTVDFDKERIIVAIQRAIVDVEHEVDIGVEEAQYPYEIADYVEGIAQMNDLTVEEIQDLVEMQLMQYEGTVAKAYILFRFKQEKERKIKKSEGLLTEKFLSQYKHKQPPMTELGAFVYYRTYSRYLPEVNRREYWWETVKRAVEYNCSLAPTTQKEAEKLFDNIFHLRQFPSGRTLFTGGTPVSKMYPMSNYNCSFTIADDFQSFKDLFYLLLIGAGVGLRIKKKDVEQLPPVRGDLKLVHKAYAPIKKSERKEYTSIQFEDDMVEIVIGDSKEAFVQGLEYFLRLFYLPEFNKVKTIIINYDNVRQAGERLKTFGGYASGHQPYLDMIDKIYEVLIDGNKGKKNLKPIDCLDIANIIGVSVVSGGVRRTSEVILFDSDDEEVKNCKSELFQQVDGEWKINDTIQHRRMSNNSIQYESKPTYEQWQEHLKLMRFTGEPGLQNLEAAKKRFPEAEGGNP